MARDGACVSAGEEASAHRLFERKPDRALECGGRLDRGLRVAFRRTTVYTIPLMPRSLGTL
jgi:hypothetical protein